MAYQIEKISEKSVLFGESPLWDNRREQLVYVDCFGKSINIFDPKTKEIVSKVVNPPNEEFDYMVFSMPCKSLNKFVAPLYSGKIIEFDWDQEVTKVLHDCKDPLKHYSDGKCDAKGRLWVGAWVGAWTGGVEATYPKPPGEVYKVTKSGDNLNSTRIAAKFDAPNGLGFDMNQKVLFWNDLMGRTIKRFDFDLENGTLENEKTFFDYKNYDTLDGSFPDGLAMDLNGNLWVACWKGGCVIKIDGNTGKLLDTIPIPVKNTTSVAFGGKSYETLYVTTTSIELNSTPVVGEPDAGKVFQITNFQDNSFKGFQEHFFNYY